MSAMGYFRRVQTELEGFGFVPNDIGRYHTAVAKFIVGVASIDGICTPTHEHRTLVESTQWTMGPFALVEPDLPMVAIAEPFFILESSEIPIPVLSLRNHFDYGVEAELVKNFGDVSPSLGPTWQYIYSCDDVRAQLADKRLVLGSPSAGTALRCRGTNPTVVYESHIRMKELMQSKLPLPIVWGIPFGLALGVTDYLRDGIRDEWYEARVLGNFEGGLALADLATLDPVDPRLAQHRYSEQRIIEVKIDPATLVIKVSRFGGRYKTTRKLKNLLLAIG
jgi:hypothetical protein